MTNSLVSPVKPGNEDRKGTEEGRRGSARRIGTALAVTAGVGVSISACSLWSNGFNLSKTGDGSVEPLVVHSAGNPRTQFPGKNRISVLLIDKDDSYQGSNQHDQHDLHDLHDPLNGARHTNHSRFHTILMLSLDLDSRKVS
ncbi:MAG: hypothetical protein V4671_14575, partial [Armatimonadota bacterium]